MQTRCTEGEGKGRVTLGSDNVTAVQQWRNNLPSRSVLIKPISIDRHGEDNPQTYSTTQSTPTEYVTTASLGSYWLHFCLTAIPRPNRIYIGETIAYVSEVACTNSGHGAYGAEDTRDRPWGVADTSVACHT